MNKRYARFADRMRRIACLRGAASLLHWDQEIYMPRKAAPFRAEQLAALSGQMHQLFTERNFGDLIKRLSSDKSLTPVQKANVADALKDYRKSRKLSRNFVETLSRTIAGAFEAWQKARKENDFTVFAPMLERIVKMKREQARLTGYKEHPYDALLDDYEPGLTTADTETLFRDVRAKLVGFVRQIPVRPAAGNAFMFRNYPADKQWGFGLHLLRQMGFDFDAGLQEKSVHPFTTKFSPDDVRVTTRISEKNLYTMIWSCIHEGGHALYEQGLPAGGYGLASGDTVSLGIHESQSRLWENNVGRSYAYWKANFPLLKKTFPQRMKKVNLPDFYRAVNIVKPSLIRVEADELTYHSHIAIRFTLEKALVEGSLSVNDLPRRWNTLYKEYLGLDVPSDLTGALQDIHWSYGNFGYFPTYSLGSFYAAQFYDAAKRGIGGLEEKIARGNMKPLLDWLRENIHRHGRRYGAAELCRRVTGRKLDFSCFMEYAVRKYSDLYDLRQDAVKNL